MMRNLNMNAHTVSLLSKRTIILTSLKWIVSSHFEQVAVGVVMDERSFGFKGDVVRSLRPPLPYALNYYIVELFSIYISILAA